MRQEVRDAIESARTVGINRPLIAPAEPQRRHSFAYVLTVLLGVVNNLPDDLSMQELRDELEELRGDADY